MITISIMLANIMQGVDNTILNVALPHIQGSLSASLDQIAWALTSYIVCAAVMMPLTGWLAGRFGIKYIFLASVAGFTIASALCGAAATLHELVLFRALPGTAQDQLVQGRGGAAQGRGDRKAGHRGEENVFDAKSAGEPAGQRHHDRGAHNVGGQRPGDLILRGREAPLHMRQRDIEGRVVDPLHD